MIITTKTYLAKIWEIKRDNYIGDSETSIDGYSAIWRDQNRKFERLACYFANKICYNNENCISNEVKNIFVKLLIPKNKTNYSRNCL